MHATPAGPLASLQFGGRYPRSPLAGSYYAAELEWIPLSREQEYAQLAQYEHASAEPVLFSPGQRNLILAGLVRELRALVPDLGCVLVRLYGPDFNIPLPVDLLAADVLLVHEPHEALPSVLAAAEGGVALIQHDLRADGLERGDNRLRVSLWHRAAPAGLAQRFADWTRSSTLLRGLEDTQLDARPDVAAEAG